MKTPSPTLEGFRALLRQPALGFAEIAWRWSFGAAAALLVTFSFLEYLDTLPVSAGDLLLLRSRQPALISQTLAHVFRGSGLRLVIALLVSAAALTFAWIGLAALGRAATLRGLVSYFRQSGNLVLLRSRTESGCLGPLLGLNFFRAAATLAAAVGCVGALLLAGSVSSPTDPSPGSVMLIFLTMTMFVGLAWSGINWFLSLAAVFAAAEGHDTFGSVAAAAELCRTRPASVLAAGTWFGLAHLVAFVVMSSVIAFPLAFAAVLPAGVVLGGVLILTLLYFAMADFLYVGRLAAYLGMLRPPSAQVDQDEPILSDTRTENRELKTEN